MLDRRAPAIPSPSPAQSQDRVHRAGAKSVGRVASHLASFASGGKLAVQNAPGSVSGASSERGGGGSEGGGRGNGGDDGRDPSGPDERGRRARYFARSMRILKRVLAVVTIIALIVYFVFGAVALILRYVVMPNVDRFRPKVEALASAQLHAPVHIGRIGAHWTGFKPTFTVTDLHIGASNPAESDASVDHIQATLAWRSLLRLQPILSQLSIDHARVTAVRDPSGLIRIGGIAVGQHHAENPYTLPSWLLGQREIVVRDLDFRWIDQAGLGHGAPPPPLLQLAHARMALVNSGRYHRFGVQGNVTVHPSGDHCGQSPCIGTAAAVMPIDVRANFQHAPFRSWLAGRAGRGNPQNWDGDLYLGATALDVAALNDYVDNTIGARAGHVDVHSWWRFDHGEVGQVSGSLKGRGLALQLRQGLPPLRIPKVDTRFAANQHDGDYHASVRDLSLELDDQAALPDGTTLGRMLNVSRFDGEYRVPRIGRGERIALSGDILDIGLLADFSRTLPLPRRLKRNIDRYDPSGVLSDYALEWEREPPEDAAAASAAQIQGDVPLRRFKLHARLDGVTLAAMPPRPGVNAAGHPHIGQPGFSNLRGVIDADQDSGQVQLDSRNATVTIRGMFDAPTLQLDTLTGTARWQIVPHGDTKRLDAHFDNVKLSNPDLSGQVQARFRTLLNTAADGYLDLNASIDRANVPMVPRYLPTSIGAPVRQYLTRMLKAGTSTGATVEAHGRLNDLPYPHGAYRTTVPVASSGATASASTASSRSAATSGSTTSASAPGTPLRKTPSSANAPRTGGSTNAQHGLPAIEQIDTPDDGAPAGGTSVFHVNAPFTNSTADVSPSDSVRLSNGEPEKWPAFDGLAGRLFVDGRQLGFDIDAGHYRQARISTLQGRIADLADHNSLLRIDTRIRGPLADFLDFAGHSPLGYWSHQIAAPAKAQGDATLTMRIDVSRHNTTGAPSLSGSAETATTASPASDATSGSTAAAASTSSPTGRVLAEASDTKAAKPRIDPVSVSGTLHFERNRVIYGEAPPVDNLTGDVAFTTHTGTSRNVRARFLGGDIRAEGSMAADASLNIQIHGHVAPERVANASDPRYAPLLRRFSGVAPYQVQVRRNGLEPTRLTLQSDLQGLGIDLPAPLNKAADTAMPVSLDWRTLSGNGEAAAKSGARGGSTRSSSALQRIDLQAGPVHAAYLRRTAPSTPVTVGSVAVHSDSAPSNTTSGATPKATSTVIAGAIGLNRLPPLPEHGVLGELHIAQFDADAWRAVLADVERPAAPVARRARNFEPDPADASPDTDANRTGGGWLPDRFDIAVDDLHLLSRHWHEVHIDGGRGARQGWQAHIASREVAGQASWQPQGGSALHARLSKLLIPAADPTAASLLNAASSDSSATARTAAANHASAASAPAAAGASATGVAQQQSERTTRTLAAVPQTTKRFPAIDLVAEQFGIAGKPVGKLSLLAHNVATADDTVWQIDDLTLSHPSATLHASGDWRVDTAGTDAHTGVDFQLAVHDAGALLTALGMPSTIKGGKGSLDGALNWDGNPGTPDLKTLEGKLKLELTRGQFLKVNPGAARLLGILSLQGLVRFLQLDFKSVFGKGLAFNSLSGTTTIHDGIASTQDATLTTAPARVTMSGTANVVDETQDFHVTVVPHLNAVSASIAAAVINPVIGLGTLVAQLALAEPISRSLTRHYLVQGHWNKPTVRRSDDNRGNIAPSTGPTLSQEPAPAH